MVVSKTFGRKFYKLNELYQANWYSRGMIRLQNAGGLGNQLFIWAAAHNLSREFDERVVIFDVKDRNYRHDRANELHWLKIYCDHKVFLKESRLLGYLLRMVDKLKLEKSPIGRNFLNKFGFYSFDKATDVCTFNRGTPKLVRSFFQRNDYVDLSWSSISREITLKLQETITPQNIELSSSQAFHFRRGDFIGIKNAHGLLKFDFFVKNANPNVRYIFCTDDPNYVDLIQNMIPTATVLTPSESDVWQSLKIFVEAEGFLGSNSTLSWWGAKLRSQNSLKNTFLPQPWTKAGTVNEAALELSGVDYKRSLFED